MASQEELNNNLLDAAEIGDVEVCRLLIEQGADVNATDDGGITPLHCAATEGHVDVCRFLIEQGAIVHATDRDGWTPLHQAAWHGRLKVCQLLNDRGANVNAVTNGFGWTPLHLAAMDNHAKVCRLLIERRANVNATDWEDWTPLDIAIRNHAVEVLVYFYLNRVVNFHQPYRNGQTPWERLTDDEKEVLRRAANIRVQGILALRSTVLPKETNGLIMRYL